MRTLQISNVGSMTVPEAVVFRNDRTCITINANLSTSKVGAKIRVTNPSGRYLDLEYDSERQSLLFILDDTIANLWEQSDSSWTFQVTPYINGTAYSAQSLPIKVANGKTLPFRTHGSAKTIYWSNQTIHLNPLRVFSFGAGTMTWGLHSNQLVLGVNAINFQTMHVAKEVMLNIASTNEMNAPTHGGSIWNDSYIPTLLNRDIRLVRQDYCDNYNYVWVYYYDIDGCPRSIMGTVVKEKYTAERAAFKRYDGSVVKDVPYSKINSNKGVITVAFTDIRKDAYITDMVYSSDIYISDCNGVFTHVGFASSDATNTREEFEDYQFDFQIMQ